MIACLWVCLGPSHVSLLTEDLAVFHLRASGVQRGTWWTFYKYLFNDRLMDVTELREWTCLTEWGRDGTWTLAGKVLPQKEGTTEKKKEEGDTEQGSAGHQRTTSASFRHLLRACAKFSPHKPIVNLMLLLWIRQDSQSHKREHCGRCPAVAWPQLPALTKNKWSPGAWDRDTCLSHSGPAPSLWLCRTTVFPLRVRLASHMASGPPVVHIPPNLSLPRPALIPSTPLHTLGSLSYFLFLFCPWHAI